MTTAMSCDRIYVFDGGTVSASGTHEQLLKPVDLSGNLSFPNEVNALYEEKKEKPIEKKKTGVLKRMLRDVSKIRRQLVRVVIMALVIIACNLLSRRYSAESSAA
ncbi:MAG: hypothetical protein ACLS4Z_04120 [Christensenellaceae bacterium]